MINRKLFFDGYKKTLDADKKLTQEEVNDLTTFLDLVEANYKMFNIPQWAYVFATTFHETNGTFRPVKEAYWLSESWRKNNLRYYPWYGRGYVQITWEDNYRKFTPIIGVDLLKNPDDTMIPMNAFSILVIGFQKGLFTQRKVRGKYLPNKISDYIYINKKGEQVRDFDGARRCINGTDKATLISNYARTFEKLLNLK